MNKLVLTFLLVSSFLGVHAQSPSDKLYEQMSLNKDVSSMTISKDMIQLFGLGFSNTDEANALDKLDLVKVLMYSPSSAEDETNFRNETLSLLPSNKYKTIEPEQHQITNGKGTADVLIQTSGLRIKECHVLFAGNGNDVLLSFFGNFKVEDLKAMAKKMERYK